MDALPEAIGAGVAGGLVYLLTKLRSERKRSPGDEFDRRWIERVEKSLARTHDLASQITVLLMRQDRTEKRMDKLDEDVEEHVAEDMKAHERIVRVEEQYKDLRRGQEDALRLAEDNNKLLAQVLHRLESR